MAKIVVLENIAMTDHQRKTLEELGDAVFFDSSTPEECIIRFKDADVVVVDWIEPNDFLSAMKSPSLLALTSTGFTWVDLARARERGISVANVPGYATEAVAEHLMGLALNVARGSIKSDKALRTGNWDAGKVRGIEFKSRTFGIVGFGRIGARTAELARGFGMNVVAYTRHPAPGSDVEFVSLDDLLKASDVIGVCCDYNELSKNMLGAAELKLLKPDAIIVAATWGIIDLEALIEKLRRGEIWGAGLDVAVEGAKEPLPEELLKLDNVILTAHIGFNTPEAAKRRIDIGIENIRSFVKGRAPRNIVN